MMRYSGAMEKVYLVTRYVPYESDDTVKVFRAKEDAEAFSDLMNESVSGWDNTEYQVVEMDVE